MKETIYLVAGFRNIDGDKVNLYETKPSDSALAKIILNEQGNAKYYILFKDNHMVNFTVPNFRPLDCKWNLVPEESFKSYCKFLKSSSIRHLTKAEHLYEQQK